MQRIAITGSNPVPRFSGVNTSCGNNASYSTFQVNYAAFVNQAHLGQVNNSIKRNNHNATERARREFLNSKLKQLLKAVPTLSKTRRPTKSTIIQHSVEYVLRVNKHLDYCEKLIIEERKETEALVSELNQLRKDLNLPPKVFKKKPRFETLWKIIGQELTLPKSQSYGSDGDTKKSNLATGKGSNDETNKVTKSLTEFVPPVADRTWNLQLGKNHLNSRNSIGSTSNPICPSKRQSKKQGNVPCLELPITTTVPFSSLPSPYFSDLPETPLYETCNLTSSQLLPQSMEANQEDSLTTADECYHHHCYSDVPQINGNFPSSVDKSSWESCTSESYHDDCNSFYYYCGTTPVANNESCNKEAFSANQAPNHQPHPGFAMENSTKAVPEVDVCHMQITAKNSTGFCHNSGFWAGNPSYYDLSVFGA